MDFYYDLKKMLCRELEEIARKQQLSAGDLEIVDKLTHSIKSIVTIMAMDDSGYSYNDGYSGARRRDSMGRYDDGYSGRRYYDNYQDRGYSRDEGKTHMIRQFEKMMDEASSPDVREVIQSALNKMKNM